MSRFYHLGVAALVAYALVATGVSVYAWGRIDGRQVAAQQILQQGATMGQAQVMRAMVQSLQKAKPAGPDDDVLTLQANGKQWVTLRADGSWSSPVYTPVEAVQ